MALITVLSIFRRFNHSNQI